MFGGRVPIINFSGGTEVGGSFLAPYPIEPIRSCSLGGPSLGMDVDVVDASGKSVRGEVGELVCRQPWPAMTRGFWRDRSATSRPTGPRSPGCGGTGTTRWSTPTDSGTCAGGRTTS
ncbi:hypothetical protein [Pseudonocardia sp. NPDC049154]|uniref:hypothetical protein n=1 Tax=Pseudonocardia sp. NPDC049154 TaxID=3155501 RepID=UPI003407D2B9